MITFSAGARFSFGLGNVDLYQPSRIALDKLWPLLSAGGIIVVDDCQPGHGYDGSRRALEGFCAAPGLAFAVDETKLGVLRRPA